MRASQDCGSGRFQTLVPAEVAVDHIEDPDWLFMDTRFELSDPAAGRGSYTRGHIPGASYVDLERDMSGPVHPGRTGRHPLPEDEAVERLFSRLGVTTHRQVVAYDEQSGAMAAARLWWLLRYAGHERVAILDGGLARWRELGLPVGGERPVRPPSCFAARFQRDLVVNATEVMEVPRGALVDSRTVERYRGDSEPIDPIGGHIPGAICLPYLDNLDSSGTMRPVGRLRERFDRLVRPGGPVAVFYCGSGVTAAHNVLAFAHAYGSLPRLYAGSWSEWITDSARPVAIGSK